MLIKISIDIWRDVFEWFAPTDRKQLALKFNELGDSQFSDICQKWLHEWTKNVCIGALKIDSMKDGQMAPLLHSWDERRQAFEIVPFAEAELPDNIVDFEQLKISHLDTEVLQFIQRMQPVFQNVHLQVRDADSLGSSQTTLGHLMPLLSDGGIDKLTIFPGQFLSAFRDQFPAQFLAINVLDVWPIFFMDAASAGQLFDLFLNWLGTRRQDGEPRVLTLDDHFDDVRPLVERIREHFHNATDPATFFIWIDSFEREPGVQGSTTNATTNEQLVVQEYVDGSSGILLIGRCSAELDGPVWVEEMDRKFGWAPESEKAEIWEKARRQITISSPTLGPIEGESRPEENAEEVAVDEPGPGRAGN